jgi:hypothetical protein
MAAGEGAARLVGHRDDAIAAGPLGHHVDAIAHLHLIVAHAPDPARFVIGSDDESMRPHTLAAPVQGAGSTFDVTPDAVLKRVESEASEALAQAVPGASFRISIAFVPYRAGGAP